MNKGQQDRLLEQVDAYVSRMQALGKPITSIAVTPAQLKAFRSMAKKRAADRRFGRDTYKGIPLRAFSDK